MVGSGTKIGSRTVALVVHWTRERGSEDSVPIAVSQTLENKMCSTPRPRERPVTRV